MSCVSYRIVLQKLNYYRFIDVNHIFFGLFRLSYIQRLDIVILQKKFLYKFMFSVLLWFFFHVLSLFLLFVSFIYYYCITRRRRRHVLRRKQYRVEHLFILVLLHFFRSILLGCNRFEKEFTYKSIEEEKKWKIRKKINWNLLKNLT